MESKMKIAITGITGNMGQAVLAAIEGEEYLESIRLLCHSRKRMKKLLKRHKGVRKKTVLVQGSVADANACKQLIEGCDLVINMGAVIPPASDKSPLNAIECNERGANALVSAIEAVKENQPRLLHVSTVALYGNRTEPHMFGRVGDPLLVSPFDVYAVTKLRGEFRVLESEIAQWAVFRQTAMLHPQMLSDNMHDGLMFHTCFDAPLEWATAHDSGLLVRNFLRRVHAGDLPETFWKRCYNIGGGARNRICGIHTLSDGMSLVGGGAEDFFRPGYNATRNFHGVWFSDGHVLNDLFSYQTQTVEDYWKEILRLHPVYKLGKIVPKGLIRTFAIKRLLKDDNAPAYWAKHNDEARLLAYFGGREAYESLQKKGWKDCAPIARYDSESGVSDNERSVDYGFDFSKADEEITLEDLKSVAAAHGGKLLSTEFPAGGGMYAKLEWETQDGERFTATPYTVLRAGHWYNPVYRSYVWDFDRLSKKDKVFASIWYDSHGTDEDVRYYLDEKFGAHAEKTAQA
jgi:nucleoside-diphosphate-sugar epimerase